MKKLKAFWEKVKVLFEKVWAFLVVKIPFLKKVEKFLRKWGWQIANLILCLVGYGSIDNKLSKGALLFGFYVFVLVFYYVFWKAIGVEHLFEKKDETTGVPIS